MNYYVKDLSSITFTILSGDLIVRRDGARYEMEFSAYDLKQVPATDAMADAFGIRPPEA